MSEDNLIGLLDLRKVTKEIWKDISGYEGLYQISSCGRVKSLRRPKKIRNGGIQMIPEKIKISTSMDKHGHQVINLWKDNKGKMFLVHRLVLINFVSPCPEGMEACHNDGDPTNNRVENLRWDTHANNGRDMKEHESCAGENNGNAKLTESDVLKIRKRLQWGHDKGKLANEFSVTVSAIESIKRRYTWKRI